MTDPEKIAAGLTEAQREAVLAMNREWWAGPYMPDSILGHVLWLREAGLVEREFGDFEQVRMANGGVCVKISACWWFRLTVLGAAVRAILEKKP